MNVCLMVEGKNKSIMVRISPEASDLIEMAGKEKSKKLATMCAYILEEWARTERNEFAINDTIEKYIESGAIDKKLEAKIREILSEIVQPKEYNKSM